MSSSRTEQPPPADTAIVAQKQPAAAAPIETALIRGDLRSLTTEQRIDYYRRVCESLGLNPLTQPFELIELDGKLKLYARKDCTEQLRALRKISLRIVSREVVQGVYVVTAQATTPDGRVDESVGAVCLGNLQGDKRANAIMRAETKSKRRVTLSICGLGLLDEAEVDTVEVRPAPAAQADAPFKPVANESLREIEHKAAADVEVMREKVADEGERLALLQRLAELRTALFERVRPDDPKAAWAAVLAKRGVTTARDLSPEQLAELIVNIESKVSALDLEREASPPGAAFRGAR